MNIRGNKIILRAIEDRDLISLHEWSNNPELQHIIGNIHFPSSMEFQKQWFDKLLNNKDNQRFAISENENGNIIGISSLLNIDWRNKHAWHGIMLGNTPKEEIGYNKFKFSLEELESIKGKGYGFDSVMATMRYAFDELGLERLDGSMIEYNTHSIKFYTEKLGWKLEGQKDNYYFHQGKWWKQIIVGITKTQYKELIELNNYWK